jgi:hypothetical protein
VLLPNDKASIQLDYEKRKLPVRFCINSQFSNPVRLDSIKSARKQLVKTIADVSYGAQRDREGSVCFICGNDNPFQDVTLSDSVGCRLLPGQN